MKGNIESLLAEAHYNNTGVYPYTQKIVSFELRAGVPLTTKNPSKYSNAVVYKVNNGDKRVTVTVVSDFGNMMTFPSVEDLFVHYEISRAYLSYKRDSEEYGISGELLMSQFCLRERLEKQIELLTEALEGLN